LGTFTLKTVAFDALRFFAIGQFWILHHIVQCSLFEATRVFIMHGTRCLYKQPF